MSKLAVLALFVLTLPPPLQPFDYDGHIKKARAAASADDFAAARREYDAALKEVHKRPGDMRAFLVYEELSRLAERQKDLATAEQYLQTGLENRRQTPFGPVAELPAWQDLHSFYVRQKRWMDAAATADRLAEIWRNFGHGAEAGLATYTTDAADDLHAAGEEAKAEMRYKSAVRLLNGSVGESPALAIVLDRLAVTLAAEGKDEEAEPHFKRAAEILKVNGCPMDVRFDYVRFLRKAGREADAVAVEKSLPKPAASAANKGTTVPPRPISRHEPEYTEPARKLRIGGTILLCVQIDPSGVPAMVHVRTPLGYGLDEKALEAVRSWRFQPGMKDGQPVAVDATIEINFRLL